MKKFLKTEIIYYEGLFKRVNTHNSIPYLLQTNRQNIRFHVLT